jgi:hypothetical protein
MMHWLKLGSTPIRLAAVLALAACASGGSPAAQSGTAPATTSNETTIIVRNESPGATDITLFVEPVGGVRQSLGRIEAAQSGTFRFTGAPGTYQLIIQTPTGSRTSDSFTIRPGTTVTWDLTTGRLTATRR